MKISKFQELIKELYFHQDSERGTSNTFIWLVEEIGELARLLKEKEINKVNTAEEIADIIAWSFSLANLLEIDLEDALNKKYPDKCIKCNSKPCQCNRI